MATRKNLCPNPSAKHNLTGWGGNATLTRTTYVDNLHISPDLNPPNTDNSVSEHNLGHDFEADTPIVVYGVRWWHDGSTPPSTVTAQLWDTSSQTLLVDSGSFSTTNFVVGAWNFIPFTDPFECDPSTSYTITVYFTGTYRFWGSGALSADIPDDSGHVVALADTGRYANSVGSIFPVTTWDGRFGLDLCYTIPSTPSLVPRSTGARVIDTSGGSFITTPVGLVVPGDIATISFYCKNDSSGYSFGKNVYVAYTRSSGGDTYPESFSTGTIGDVGNVFRFSYTAAPAPALATGIYLLFDNLVSSNVGFEFTGVMYEKVGSLGDYFDGDSLDAVWDSTDGNSPSTYTDPPTVSPGAFLSLM